MHLTRRSLFISAVFLSCLAAFCGCEKVADADSKPTVWVTIEAQKFFVQAIAGDRVEVEVLVRPGLNPETYNPSASEMARLAKANIFFGIGMPIEATLLNKLESSMQGLQIVVPESVDYAAHDHAHDHAHAHAGHEHGDQDPHIWMDPTVMVAFSSQVLAALSALQPEHAAEYQANAQGLQQALQTLDVELSQQLLPYAGRAFFINHPSLGHFAERYQLRQLSIEQMGSSPSARKVSELIRLAQQERVHAIFTQPQFGRSSASILAEALAVDVIEINPLAEDYITNMHFIADSLVKSFSE